MQVPAAGPAPNITPVASFANNPTRVQQAATTITRNPVRPSDDAQQGASQDLNRGRDMERADGERPRGSLLNLVV
jgi:hypothetical protein